jgi:hypothetical protein
MDKTKARAGIWRTVKKLDAKIPKWRRLIDIDKLDLGTTDNCPCGQVFGEYGRGLEELGLYPEEAEYYALALPIEPEDEIKYNHEYAKLTDLWKEVL